MTAAITFPVFTPDVSNMLNPGSPSALPKATSETPAASIVTMGQDTSHLGDLSSYSVSYPGVGTTSPGDLPIGQEAFEKLMVKYEEALSVLSLSRLLLDYLALGSGSFWTYHTEVARSERARLYPRLQALFSLPGLTQFQEGVSLLREAMTSPLVSTCPVATPITLFLAGVDKWETGGGSMTTAEAQAFVIAIQAAASAAGCTDSTGMGYLPLTRHSTALQPT